MSHPSSSIPLFTQLVQRLRHTNARYDQIAHQCRRTQRPTHHAKRRAYRAGLRIDTSKARDAVPGRIVSAASIPVLDGSAGSPAWVATETEIETEEDDSDSSAQDACTPRRLGLALRHPEVVVKKQSVTLGCLSPLRLELGLGSNVNVNVDDADTCDLPFPFVGPVPGAPRWRSIPLPDDECGMKVMTLAKSVSCTYDPNVWRGVNATHVSNLVSIPVDVAYAALGITVPPRRLKRKLRDVKVEGRVVFSRQPEIGVVEDRYFLGARRGEAKRRRGGL